MAKSDKKETKQEINTEQKRVNDQFGALTNEMDAKRAANDAMLAQERNQLKGTLEGMSGMSGGLDPTVVQNIRNTYGGKTVGYDTGTGTGSSGGGGDSGGGSSGSQTGVAQPAPVDPYEKPKSVYGNFADTGGVEMERMRTQISGLEEMAKSGAIDPAQKDSINATIQKLKDFQFDPAALQQIQGQIGQLTEMGRTGGYDPARLAQINSDIDSLRQWSQTGGVDADRLAKMRGTIDFMQGGGISGDDLSKWRGTGYDEFARTGGYSDADRADIRDRSTSGIPAMFRTQMDEAQRLRNAQGGSGGAGFLAAAGKANRQGAQEMATARRNAEIDLGSQVREGRRWGIEGLAGTEKDIQAQYGLNRGAGMQAGNQLELGVGEQRLSGLADVAERQAALEKDISGNRITATELSGRLNKDTQDSINDAFIRSKQGAGTLETNLADAIGKNRVAAQQAAAAAEATAQKLRQEGQLAGAQGLMQVAAQKAAEAARSESNANAARANDQANERWWANYTSSNERWIGEQQQQGQQYAVNQGRMLYGMDPGLERDRFATDTASQWAGANRGLLQTDVAADQKGGGKSWTDYLAAGASALGGGFGGGGSSNYNGSGDYRYDSDNPNSVWYSGSPSLIGNPRAPDPSEWD